MSKAEKPMSYAAIMQGSEAERRKTQIVELEKLVRDLQMDLLAHKDALAQARGIIAELEQSDAKG